MALAKQDVVIVGAGPAGCVLGLLLARSGVRVALFEQNQTLDRAFRGPFFSPSSFNIFQQLGLMERIEPFMQGKQYEITLGSNGKKLITVDLHHIKGDFNYQAFIPHAPLLELLIKEACQYSNFMYFGGCGVTGLLLENGVVSGVITSIEGKGEIVRSRLVVGADGRFSAVRQAVGIKVDATRVGFDLLWVNTPPVPGDDRLSKLSVNLESGGSWVGLPEGEKGSLFGFFIPKDSFPQLRGLGIQAFHEKFGALIGDLKDTLIKATPDFSFVHLLDVQVGVAQSWFKDGLLLIGDAAHISSPIMSQGNNLAIADAAKCHPHIVYALKTSTAGVLPASCFKNFAKKRRFEVKLIQKIQSAISHITNSKSAALQAIARVMLPKMQKTPIGKNFISMMFLGVHPQPVDNSLFKDDNTATSKLQSYHFCKVLQKIQETPSATTLVVEIPPTHQFDYKPGQFLTLRLFINGKLYNRCYSLSSSPDQSNQFNITVKKVPEGIISSYLCDNAKIGEEILILPPMGSFTANINATAKKTYCLLAGGSGITPIMSIIRTVLQQEPRSNINFVYANSDVESIIFKDELEKLADQFNQRFKITHVLSKAPTTHFECLTDRLNPERITQLFQLTNPASAQCEYYVCGPGGLKAMVLQTLTDYKIPSDKIHVENFSSVRATSVVDGVSSAKTKTLTISAANPDQDGTNEQFSVILRDKNSTLNILEGETLLDASLRQNISIPFSCMQGICGSCKVKLTAGKVEMNLHESLSQNDIDTNCILTCQAKPLSKKVSINCDI